MAAGAAVSREGLFRTIREHWQATEDAIAAAGQRFDRPAHDAWTVGDIFRHITAANHEIASRIRTLIATGELPFGGDAGNTAGVEKFRALDSRMLRIELNTAHGVVWMYIQRFSDEDLAKTYPEMGKQVALGDILLHRVLHEVAHVAEALEAAGIPASAVVPVETAHRWA